MKNLLKYLFLAILIFNISVASAQYSGLWQPGVYESHLKTKETKTKNKSVRPISEHNFKILYDIAKEETFASEKLKILRVGALGNYFTCDQCSRLLFLFSFDKDRLDALKILSRRLIIKKDSYKILEHFTFSMNVKEAAKILEESDDTR